jgi:tripartite-type tricarboxylate transporter receptor subunit TctC
MNTARQRCLLRSALCLVLAPAAAGAQARVAGDIGRVFGQPDTRERFAALGIDPCLLSQDEFTALVRADVERIGRLIRDAGIKAE